MKPFCSWSAVLHTVLYQCYSTEHRIIKEDEYICHEAFCMCEYNTVHIETATCKCVSNVLCLQCNTDRSMKHKNGL